MTITSLKIRFEELKTFESNFGFLCDSRKLQSLDDNKLIGCCVKFHSNFSHDNSSYVDVDDLFSELKVIQFTLSTEIMSTIDILKFIKDTDYYPNVSITYRVLLTMHVIVASAEISFSKLKLIKTYLRFSMSQERLNIWQLRRLKMICWKTLMLMCL
jgi:NADH:ubiquinone oxidoreductase subunit K